MSKFLTAFMTNGDYKILDTNDFTTNDVFDTDGNIGTTYKPRFSNLSDGLWVEISYYDISSRFKHESFDVNVAVPQAGAMVQFLDKEEITTLAWIEDSDKRRILSRHGDALVNNVLMEIYSYLYVSEAADMSMADKAAEIFESLYVDTKQREGESDLAFDRRIASMMGWESSPDSLIELVNKIRASRSKIEEDSIQEDIPGDIDEDRETPVISPEEAAWEYVDENPSL